MNKNKLIDRFRPIPPIPEDLTLSKLDELCRFIEIEAAKVTASSLRTKKHATLIANAARTMELKDFTDRLHAKGEETLKQKGEIS